MRYEYLNNLLAWVGVIVAVIVRGESRSLGKVEM